MQIISETPTMGNLCFCQTYNIWGFRVFYDTEAELWPFEEDALFGQKKLLHFCHIWRKYKSLKKERKKQKTKVGLFLTVRQKKQTWCWNGLLRRGSVAPTVRDWGMMKTFSSSQPTPEFWSKLMTSASV